MQNRREIRGEVRGNGFLSKYIIFMHANVIRSHTEKKTNTCKSVYKCTCSLMYMAFLIWDDNAPSKSQRHPNKTPNAKHEKHCFEWLAMAVQKTTQTHNLWLLSLVSLQRWKICLYC